MTSLTRTGLDESHVPKHPARRPIRHIKTPKKAAVLAAYPHTGTVKQACETANVARGSHYEWLKTDPEYAAAFEDAREQFTESLEAEAVRRAREGYEEPVFHNGKIIGHRRRFSDLLMIFLLKANNPDRYRETIRQEHNRLNDQTGLPVMEIRYVSANGHLR